ncbi:MAG: tetratricopeptide repeat protein [Planctomycetaceae bacterium]|jgi:hypothetical protein
MDSQTQHELETNELHKLLVKLNRFLEAHGNKVALLLAGLAIAVVAGVWLQRGEQAKELAGWRALAGASSPADLKAVAQEHGDATVGPWAKLMEAEQLLAQSQKALFLDKDAGRKDAERARDSFESLINNTEAAREVRERSQFGLGQAEETLADGSPTKALEAYKTLIERFPGTYFEDAAKARIKRLERGGSAEFYSWFAQFERPKAKDRRPLDGNPLDGLGLPNDLILPPSPTSKSAPGEGSGPVATEEEATEGEPEMETEGEKKGAEAAPETPAEPAPEAGAKEPESGDKVNPESP